MLNKSTPYFSYAWAGLMTVLLFIFFFGNLVQGQFLNGLLTSFWVLVFAAPALLKVWVTKKSNEIAESINGQISKLLGSTLPRFNHFEKNTAIILRTDNNEVVLANPQGVVKSYPYSAIREWENRSETAGQQSTPLVLSTSGAVAAQGAMMGIAAAQANSRAREKAAANTGLYLTVKDVDHPEWRIAMSSPEERKRWFEILNQTINEGGVA